MYFVQLRIAARGVGRPTSLPGAPTSSHALLKHEIRLPRPSPRGAIPQYKQEDDAIRTTRAGSMPDAIHGTVGSAQRATPSSPRREKSPGCAGAVARQALRDGLPCFAEVGFALDSEAPALRHWARGATAWRSRANCPIRKREPEQGERTVYRGIWILIYHER